MLQDILESGNVDRDKSTCILARYKTSATSLNFLSMIVERKTLYNNVYENDTFRLFTTKELERLQTVPEGYVDNIPGISENMKANLLGDGLDVDVIAHIFSFLQ